MKPHLVIGLGNPLMGDEGVAWHVLDRLAADSRLPEDTEALWAGTDLLACTGQMAGRKTVTLLDALLDPSEPGRVWVFDDGFADLESRQPSVHQLSVVEALRLLRTVDSSLRAVRFRLLAIAIPSAQMAPELSPQLAARLPEVAERVLERLAGLAE